MAMDVDREVSGSPDVNIMGGCLGGMTAAIVEAHLAARAHRHDQLVRGPGRRFGQASYAAAR